MPIPKETISIIRERARIEDIISRYIPSLKKRGQNYVGLCPFHKEKTPSFVVSPEKQIFHCFGCHIGGNVFSFIQKIEKSNFPQSVKTVGDLVGIRVDDSNFDEINKKYNDYKRINNYAMNLYHACLKSNKGTKALNYLLERGVNEESIDIFKLGYTPKSWDFLTDKLIQHNANLRLAEVLGLIKKNKNNNYFDYFRDRVIFPIINQSNDICAFGGRVINDDLPKYLNSPESEIFKKRKILYGFSIAKNEISRLNRVIIVEGYLDVIGCHQSGIKNVVAPLGTALTIEHIKFLSRYTEEIIILFDADSAGINASLKSLEVVNETNIDIKIALLPEDDPFEFIQKNGIRKLMAIIDNSLNPIDFKINLVKNDNSLNTPLKKILRIFNILKEIKYETELQRYLDKVSDIFNIDKNIIQKDFQKYQQGIHVEKLSINNKNEKLNFLKNSYKDLIILLCNYPSLIEKAIIDFNEFEINDSIYKNIFNKLIYEYSVNNNITLAEIFDFFDSDQEKIFLEKNIKSDYLIDDPNKVYTEIYLSLKLFEIDKKINNFNKIIKKNKDNIKNNEYLTEIEIYKREKEKISNYFYNLQNKNNKKKTINSF